MGETNPYDKISVGKIRSPLGETTAEWLKRIGYYDDMRGWRRVRRMESKTYQQVMYMHYQDIQQGRICITPGCGETVRKAGGMCMDCSQKARRNREYCDKARRIHNIFKSD
jgi:hypothetical protein